MISVLSAVELEKWQQIQITPVTVSAGTEQEQWQYHTDAARKAKTELFHVF